MSTSNELFTLLYGILDKLERIEQHLGIEDKKTELDGGVKFSVITSDNFEEKSNIIEFEKHD